MLCVRLLNNIITNRLISTKSRLPMEIIEEPYLASLCKHIVPLLSERKHKGQAGRVGVIGGSLEYTGAPYFAGISALKVGADLTHVFCTKEAAPVIKSYSPELIVHPLLHPEVVDKALQWLERLHVIVIGPGLGRESDTFDTVTVLINACRKLQKPLVIDADGLFLISIKPELINDYPATVILTPNLMEYSRLFNANETGMLERFGSNCTVVKKGEQDMIFDGARQVICSVAGSGRRCGGQGDLLSGAIATFTSWAREENSVDAKLKILTGCYAACKLTRLCNAKAFASHGRSMTCSDMIEDIGVVFRDHFDE